MRLAASALLLLWLSSPVLAGQLQYHEQTLSRQGAGWILRLPQGLELELLTDALDAPRLMTFLPNADLLVGSRSGKVYRLPPPYHRPEVLVELPDYPHSLAWRDGDGWRGRPGSASVRTGRSISPVTHTSRGCSACAGSNSPSPA